MIEVFMSCDDYYRGHKRARKVIEMEEVTVWPSPKFIGNVGTIPKTGCCWRTGKPTM